MEKLSRQLNQLSSSIPHLEKVQDMTDHLIDIILNYRQSGHPGGSRSKTPIMVNLMLSGAMTYDLRNPEKRFADRFILSAGHTVPVVYTLLSVLNEALRLKFQKTGNSLYKPHGQALFYEDLITFRRQHGLPGHAEMSGKTLFLKFNTGPSGHGNPAAAGQAIALKLAGLSGVKVFALEGDAALTTGVTHETKNSAWALGLSNFYWLVDWNNFGIDDHPLIDTVPGTPEDWFKPYGFRVLGTCEGNNLLEVGKVLLELSLNEGLEHTGPHVAWFKTLKGRGYLVFDNKSHGSPHPPNSDIYWETKKPLQDKYGILFEGFGEPSPKNPLEFKTQTEKNIKKVLSLLQEDSKLADFVADTLVEIGETVPTELKTFKLSSRKNPFQDQRLYDYQNYPSSLYVPPGTKTSNRMALGKWGSYINYLGAKDYGRPLFIVASADLAKSTNIFGFADKWEDFRGFGEYHPEKNTAGSLLPQEITEFGNAGILGGMVTVNLAENPYEDFDGFWGACSTYGSFAYLKYGIFRILSQLAQDCPLKLGKILWVVGHSGPETADDSRTHFGIFAPGVTQLFPKGSIINLHPWEYNEVPVVLGAALALNVPIIALHLTRPSITIPDRTALKIAPYWEAARGAYLIRDFEPNQPKMGTIIVRGSSSTDNLIKVLPEINQRGYNIKIIVAISRELFDLQNEEYRNKILPLTDWTNSIVITNEALCTMQPWIYSKECENYSLSSDWDNRWRTGGTVDEVLDEAHLTPEWLLKGIEKFVNK
ncbi:MAG: Transketolase 1 [candidate division WS2 bacterium]|nr:Transketolase 1 [Candidatus Psychracetigena formicireducens]